MSLINRRPLNAMIHNDKQHIAEALKFQLFFNDSVIEFGSLYHSLVAYASLLPINVNISDIFIFNLSISFRLFQFKLKQHEKIKYSFMELLLTNITVNYQKIVITIQIKKFTGVITLFALLFYLHSHLACSAENTNYTLNYLRLSMNLCSPSTI